MNLMWGMLIIGLLLLLSPYSFVVGFTMACMAGICLTLYYLSENCVIGKQKRDPSEIPLEEKGEKLIVEYGWKGDYYYETAEIIKGVYKPGRIVAALYNGQEIETAVQDVGYGYFVMIDGKHFSKKTYL